MSDKILSLCVSRSSILDARAKYLIETYKCFTEPDNKSIPPRWIQRNRNAAAAKVASEKPSERTRIGIREFSIEAITRKEFMAHMNKLTTTNKNTVLKALKTVIREDCTHIYVDITWDMMRRASEFSPVYYEVLKLLNEEHTRKRLSEIWTKYYADRAWYPTTDIITEDYDEFCDFVKWKKHAIASIHIWILLCDKGIMQREGTVDILIREIANDFTANIPTCIADALLDQAIVLINGSQNIDALVNVVNKWIPLAATELKSSSRFKLYDIHEAIQGKMKPVYKVPSKRR